MARVLHGGGRSSRTPSGWTSRPAQCYLDDRFRQATPVEDPNLKTLWQGIEQVLLDQLPRSERIITTWEDIYQREQWQAFLLRQGYTPDTPATFVKQLR